MSPGWQWSIAQIRERLSVDTTLPSLNACIVLSESILSRLNRVVLYPAAFSKGRISFVYRIGIDRPSLLMLSIILLKIHDYKCKTDKIKH
nr:MAG TPA: hypothetical protein [Caudoviricetes sp.]